MKEATYPTGVASRIALLADFEQNRIAVAINEDLQDVLPIAAFFPLAPEPTAAATVIHGPAGCHRFSETFGVHVGKHEDGARLGVLSHGRK